jgi:hypothetical protein
LFAIPGIENQNNIRHHSVPQFHFLTESKEMIRDHLYQWRVRHPAKNLQEYLDSITELPEQDRECAAALWGVRNKQDIMTILLAFTHLDRWRELTPA